MKTVILTFEAFAENARVIGGQGAVVLTRWDAKAVAGAELLMVFLHPSADGFAWVDDSGRFVTATYDVERADLRGAVVFLGVCYGVENAQMVRALATAGTRVIVAGPGINVGGGSGMLAGADWLAKGLRVMMGAGLTFWAAWPAARAITRVRAGPDAMGYRVVYQKSQEVKSRPEGSPTGAGPGAGASPAPTRRRWATWAAGVLAVVAFAVQVLLGWGAVPTTFFSSLVPTPTSTAGPVATYTRSGTRKPWDITPFPTTTPCPGVGCLPTPGAHLTYDLYMPSISKEYAYEPYIGEFLVELYVNSVITTSDTITVSYGDTLIKVDHVAIVDSGDNVTFTLLIQNPTMITNTGWISTTGSVVTGTNVMTWTVNNVAAYQYWVITTTWDVLSGTFTTGDLDEELVVYCCDAGTSVFTLNYAP